MKASRRTSPKRVRHLIGLAVCVSAMAAAPMTVANAASTSGNAPATNYEGGTVPANIPDAGANYYNGQKATVDEVPFIAAGLREGGPRPQGQSCTVR